MQPSHCHPVACIQPMMCTPATTYALLLSTIQLTDSRLYRSHTDTVLTAPGSLRISDPVLECQYCTTSRRAIRWGVHYKLQTRIYNKPGNCLAIRWGAPQTPTPQRICTTSESTRHTTHDPVRHTTCGGHGHGHTLQERFQIG